MYEYIYIFATLRISNYKILIYANKQYLKIYRYIYIRKIIYIYTPSHIGLVICIN